MSRKYKFYNEKGVYLISFSTVNWIDVFTRSQYKDIVVESINYCIEEKGLEVFAWVIMSNHVHFVARTQKEPLEDILRDLKKYTSKAIIKAIEENPQESRKGWLLWMFERAGNKNSNNSRYQFLVFRTFLQHPRNYLIIKNSFVILGVAKYLLCISER